MAIGSGGYYGEQRIGANYGDDDIGDYDDVGNQQLVMVMVLVVMAMTTMIMMMMLLVWR